MAKYKPAGSRKTAATRSSRGWIPCLVLLIAVFALIFWLMYAVMRSGR